MKDSVVVKDSGVEERAVGARAADVPRYAYLIAVAIGLFGLPFMYALIDFFAAGLLGGFMTWYPGEGDGGVRPAVLFFALANGLLGAFFGLVWPEPKWRWGVWLCALPTCLVSVFEPALWFFLAWVAVTLLPACAGAHTAGALHLKYVAVDEDESGGRESL